ncbi:quinone oxidoreductase family protein [Geodermatophilus sp. CPCC 206100]|uniref:quinone oxidoreductase family protein n=1 Tax=Geodermatophilus sp. CPCC 206100 TaxID=3020054 RepID=UPI003B000A55
MRAVVLAAEGAAPALADVPAPEPAAGEVLVRVSRSSVNPHDALVASGAAARYMEYRFPVVLGSDLAGTVEAVGAGVDDLRPGERVFGLVRERVAARGAFAELVAVPRGWVVPVPDGVEDSAAGALGLAALTALRCVEAVDPSAGDTVLVVGATGGVGSYAVQLVTARGARVVATARAGEEEAHVRALGASEVVDWSAGDVAAQVQPLHPRGIAAVIDLVDRDPDVLSRLAAAVLVPGGAAVSTGHAADPDRLPGLRARNVLAEVDQDALREIAALAGSGRLRAPVTRTCGIEEIGSAFGLLRDGALGKIAVRV